MKIITSIAVMIVVKQRRRRLGQQLILHMSKTVSFLGSPSSWTVMKLDKHLKFDDTGNCEWYAVILLSVTHKRLGGRVVAVIVFTDSMNVCHGFVL